MDLETSENVFGDPPAKCPKFRVIIGTKESLWSGFMLHSRMKTLELIIVLHINAS